MDAVTIDRMHISGEVASRALDMRWGNWHGKEVYPLMRVDPAVTVTTGKALGNGFYYHYWSAGAPTGVVNAFGKGRAVLLNFSLENAPMGPLIRDLLATAGAKPEIVVRGPDGELAEDVEITRWHNGEIELVSLFGSYEGRVQVTLPQEKHVYDLKGREVLGCVRQFGTQVRASRAGFYALLPGRAPAPRIALKQNRAARGSTVTATLSIAGASGLHALRVCVSDPAGRAADWLNEIVLVGRDAVDVDLPFAFNDDAGAWSVEVRDLYAPGAVSTRLVLE